MTAAIVLILLMASVSLMADLAVKPAQAQLSAMLGETQQVPAGVTPYLTRATKPYISIRDNVIGLGQTQVINVWVSPSLETNRRYFNNITKAFEIVVTKPDGTVVKYYPGNANSEGTQWQPVTVDKVGIWKVQYNFLGTYFPRMVIEVGQAFGSPAGTILESLYMQPSSTDTYNFTVQQELMQSWPPSPLPTDLWSWPVDFHNREWWQIMGAWPGTGYNARSYASYFNVLYPDTNPTDVAVAMFTPFVAGPNSAHVLRKETRAIGGIKGGAAGITGTMADDSYPSVVFHGRCYKQVTKVVPTLQNGTYRNIPQSVAECFDLRTGQIYYDIPVADGGITPTIVGYDQGISVQSDTQTFSEELLTISGGRLYKINPLTGAVTTNVSLPTGFTSIALSGFGGSTGTLVSQVEETFVTVQNLGNTTNPGPYRLINWTAVGSNSNFTTRIYSNTSYASSNLPSFVDWNVGLGATVASYGLEGMFEGQNVTGYNAITGQRLWSVNVSEPMYSPFCSIADHGKIAILSMYGVYVALNLNDGSRAWTSDRMNYPFGASSFGIYGIASAYGLLFRPSYDGIYAFNWSTGKLQWWAPRYAKAFDESTYTEFAGGSEVYPGQTQVRIADGKVYIYDGEHSPQQPITRGWSLYCFDVYTGKEIWELPVFGATMFSTPPSTGPIVDGYLYFPASNGVTYIIGKGPTKTTVAASPKTATEGTQVLIEGKVLDESPAQPDTPCVDSGTSMKTQMSYLHLQYSITGIYGNETITGVPVSLSATGSDGTFYDLGTVTTNGYYGTFSKAWTPPKQDTYTIMATFHSDASYGSSSDATAVTVGPKPETGGNTNDGTGNVAVPDYTWTIIGGVVAILIALALVAVLILRKK